MPFFHARREKRRVKREVFSGGEIFLLFLHARASFFTRVAYFHFSFFISAFYFYFHACIFYFILRAFGNCTTLGDGVIW